MLAVANPPPGTSTTQKAAAEQTAPLHSGLAAPAFFAAICFVCGDALSQCCWVRPGGLLVSLSLVMSITLLAAFRAKRVVPACAAVVLAMVGLFCAEVQPRPPVVTPLGRIAEQTPTPSPSTRSAGIATSHTIEGAVTRTMPLRQIESFAPYSDVVRQEQSQQIDVRVAMVDGVPLPSPEGLRLTLYASADARFPALACGSEIRGPVEMHTEERFLDPGVWDAGEWLRQQGIVALGSGHADSVTLAATNKNSSFPCWIHSLQQAASVGLVSYAERTAPARIPQELQLSPDDAAMLTAMLTGDRTLLGHRLRVGFERTGSFHLLVVSGMHLAIFSGLVFWAARRLHLGRVGASLATIALSLAYALLTGFGQPVQRAFWMVALYLVGRMLWRERRPMNAIGFAALTMLVANPAAIADAGF